MSRYPYEPLPSEGYIRVLTIEPAERDSDDIVVRLSPRRFDLNNAPWYEALSYVWGTEQDPNTIQVRTDSPEGVGRPVRVAYTLPVTQNLDCALRNLRQKDSERIMWIDAICIDQTNDQEKGHQVAMMGDIYRLAAKVVVWLGPECDDSSHAMRRLQDIGSQVTVDFQHNVGSLWTSTNQQITEKKLLPFDEADQRAIFQLLSRPYFTRLWIRQEIYLADPQATIIVCGAQTVPWYYLRNALGALQLISTPSVDHVFNQEFLSQKVFLRSFTFQPRTVAFHRLRQEFGDASCKDPRDRIFAVLGLLHPHDLRLNIKPDYTRTVSEVFEDLAQRSINLYNNVNILAACQIEDGFLPTWAPDWSTKPSVKMWLRPPTSASSVLTAWYEFPKAGVLRVAGVSVTHITRLYSLTLDEWFATAPMEAQQQAFESLCCALRSQDLGSSYVGGGDVLGAYATALVSGHLPEAFEPPISDFPRLDEYKEWLAHMASTDYVAEADQWKAKIAEGSIWGMLRTWSIGRTLFIGTDGFIGLGPSSAQEGDVVCVFLGSDVPILLRPAEDSSFMVVGECYVAGVSAGETLLGPLPADVQGVYAEASDGGFYCGYRNNRTGETSFEDPRLSSLSLDLTEHRRSLAEGGPALIEVEPDILKEAGVDVRCFNLI
ncbi:unnamed protein product [Discula destructiva]